MVTGIILVLLLTNLVTLVVAIKRRKPADEAPVAEVAHAEPVQEGPVVPPLSADTVARLEQATKTAFEQAVSHAGERFNSDLDGTSERLNQLIIKLTTEVVEKELEQYRQSLVKAREEAVASLHKMQDEVSKQETSIKADLDAVVEQRRTFMLDQLDKRIGQVVAGYLVESLGRGVDLGAQQAYLLDSLERNKEALKKDIRGEL